MSLFKNEALDKLRRERADFKGGKHGAAIVDELHNTLEVFARQDEEFAQAIAQSDKTLSDCAEAIMKGVGSCISDIEVFRRAAAFYFPGSDVRMTMTIDLCPSADEGDTKPALTVIDLNDFL